MLRERNYVLKNVIDDALAHPVLCILPKNKTMDNHDVDGGRKEGCLRLHVCRLVKRGHKFTRQDQPSFYILYGGRCSPGVVVVPHLQV
jgi:hypothetical protein